MDYSDCTMKTKTIETEDGSHSLYVEELDEHYHSTKGAIQESRHVFIQAGLHYTKVNPVNILEIGFGTGLNALLSILYAEEHSCAINYTAIEKYPLNAQIAAELNYARLTGDQNNYFENIHNTAWGTFQPVAPFFNLKKTEADMPAWHSQDTFDLIFFDAFGPDKQPEMWSQSILNKMYSTLKENGILVTYSAKGLVRRRLQAAGFNVEKIPGPPGKHHMTRAVKNALV